MFKERRIHNRLALHTRAKVQQGDQSVEGESENLSLDGAFVRSARQMHLNDIVLFSISTPDISAKAKVVRVTSTGMGLQFEKSIFDRPTRS